MNLYAFPAHGGPLAINLNGPGRFYQPWSWLDISLANLIVIAVMIVIFGAALLIKFPHAERGILPPEEESDEPARISAAPAPGDAGMWTAKARTTIARLLPPKKLLPDRQPGYVASWIYTFGVASLVGLAIAIASGFALALGGPDWWRTNPVGHFFNSLHLWSVELFMAFMVIHLWGKFWMAAWRGRRAWTWITGVVAFVASIMTAFTGYLSQQNFDSQWIATNGKDAFNAVGVGAYFNVMNLGQMLMLHIVLMPLVLVLLVGLHVVLVRLRGVSHPLPAKAARGKAALKAAAQEDAAPWRGPTRRYDILKEGAIATVVVTALVILLAGILSSPDVPSLTIKTWAKASPIDFVGTSASELNGTSTSSQYGPPYNNGTGQVQHIGPFHLQTLVGVTQSFNAAQVFVLSPLRELAPTTPALSAALATYTSAPSAQQLTWANAYATAVTKATSVPPSGLLSVRAAGPVPVMMAYELKMAQSGTLDADLVAQHPFYGTDYTKPLLFVNDGTYYSNLATNMHLTGGQWGVMNETGSYPGQPWLWLYQLWYHVAPFSTSTNADMWAVLFTGICTALLLFIPFIPGLRDIPRYVPVYRLIWRSWYRTSATPTGTAPAAIAEAQAAHEAEAESSAPA